MEEFWGELHAGTGGATLVHLTLALTAASLHGALAHAAQDVHGLPRRILESYRADLRLVEVSARSQVQAQDLRQGVEVQLQAALAAAEHAAHLLRIASFSRCLCVGTARRDVHSARVMAGAILKVGLTHVWFCLSRLPEGVNRLAYLERAARIEREAARVGRSRTRHAPVPRRRPLR